MLFHDKVECILDTPFPTVPPARADDATRTTYDRFVEDDKLTRSTMLTFIDPDL